MSFSVKLDGVDGVLKYFSDLEGSLKDIKGFHQEVAEETIKEIHKSFEDSESPLGGRWAPLKKKRADGSSKPLVTKNATLMNSFRIMKLTAKTAVIGSTVNYGRWHQAGTDTIPRRAFLPFTERGDLVITDALQGIINRSIDKWFGTFDKKDTGDNSS